MEPPLAQSQSQPAAHPQGAAGDPQHQPGGGAATPEPTLHQQAARPTAQRVWRRVAGAGGQRWLLTPRAEALAAQLADSSVRWSGSTRPPVLTRAAASGCSARLLRLRGPAHPAGYLRGAGQGGAAGGAGYSLWDKRLLPQLWQSGAGHGLHHHRTGAGSDPRPASGEDRLVVLMGSHHPLAGRSLSLDDYLAWPHLQVSGGGDKDSPVEQVLAPQGLSRRWFARCPSSGGGGGVAAHRLPADHPAHIAWQLSCEHALHFAICRLSAVPSSIICCGTSAITRIRPTSGFANWPTPSCASTCNARWRRAARC